MTVMSGKAEGRCRGVEGVPGWFSPTFTGYAAALVWRDGQTSHEPEVRDRWLIIDRLDARWGVVRTWCLPPGMAEQARRDPAWTPEVHFDLLRPELRWQLIDEADAAGRPRPGREPVLPREECLPALAAASPIAKPKRRIRKPPAAGS